MQSGLSSLEVANFHRTGGREKWRSLLVVVCLWCFVSGVSQADTQTQSRAVLFDIPQQRADLSLTTFAEQANITLIFTFELARTYRANRLIGFYRPNEAIELLLEGSGLEPTFSGDGYINIAPAHTPEVEGEEMNNDNKTGLLALVLGVFSAMTVAQENIDERERDRKKIEEVVVVGTQIKGAAISDALSVSIIGASDIEAMGISSGDELLDLIPEQGQNFVNEAENISGGVNSARGDIGAFNLRNMGTGNTLVLLNGRRMVQAAGYQTELVGGSFVPANSVNSNAIPVYGVDRIEVLRDGASAIYGADAVAGVVNTVLKTDFEGFNIKLRWDDYDNLPRNDERVNIEWGKFFNGGRTNVGIFADYYHRDRVNSQDDPRWANADFRDRVPEDSPWAGDTAFRNDSIDSEYGQFDMSGSVSGLTDSAGEFEVYPLGDSRCEGGFTINEVLCGHSDGQGQIRHNLNANRDLASELDRYNIFAYVNHDFDNGMQSFTELAYYRAETNLLRHASTTSTGSELTVGASNYYNPFGPCGSPNRLPDAVIGNVSCDGKALLMDYYRWTEVPRIVDNENTTWRFLTGLRGDWGNWSWEGAVLWSKAERDDITRNRISNNLMQEALNDPTPAAYNPFHGGVLESNIERALVDVYRKNKSELKLIDFKISSDDLFNLPGGPVGFVLGAEYREEDFVDDRDPRLDGTITYTNRSGLTYPYVSDVVNSSPSSDSRGGRDVTSLFAELAVPVWDTTTPGIGSLDMQVAMRYEDLSDVGDSTVGKVAFGWRPFTNFLVRGSWSEAFRAPNLIMVNEGLVVRTNSIEDVACIYAEQQSGADLDCVNGVQRRASGSEELLSEESENTSIGFVFTPTESLTLTLDYWSIEKEGTIGLFGEGNHTALDLLLRIDAGLGNCAQTFNPAVGRLDANDDEIAAYTAAGICPGGVVEYVNDQYANLDTRTVEGHDIGVYWGIDTAFGDFNFRYVGTFYDKYEQTPGPLSAQLLSAADAGVIPPGGVSGFGDLLGEDGNQDEKHNVSVRWRKDNWGATVSAFKIGSFYQSSLTLSDGTKYVIPSMTTYNMSVDYRFALAGTKSRLRLGVNNLTDERAPLADRYFGYFADAHRDYGRSMYLELTVGFD